MARVRIEHPNGNDLRSRGIKAKLLHCLELLLFGVGEFQEVLLLCLVEELERVSKSLNIDDNACHGNT